MDQKKQIKTYSVILFSIIFSKILALVRNSFITALYGTGIAADAFYAASKIPLTLYDITLGTAIASAFVPVLNEYIAKKSKETDRYVSNFATFVGIISSLVAVFGMVFPKILIGFIASGFEGEKLALTISLLRIVMPITLFAGLCFIFIGYLQSFGNFVVPALVSVVSNLAIIIYFIGFNKFFGIKGLAAALLIGWVLQFAILIPWIIKNKYKYRPVLDLKDEGMKKSFKMAGPILISSWVQPINNIIGTNLASRIKQGQGGISVLDPAYNLYLMVSSIFSFAMTNLYFPQLSRTFASGDIKEGGNIGRKLLKSVTTIIMPIMFIFIVLSKDIVKLFYVRGAFSAEDGLLTAKIMSLYAIGMLAFSWQEILNKFFYSMQNSKIPMISAIIGIGINLSLVIFLYNTVGIFGISLSTAISSIVMAIFLYVMAAKKVSTMYSSDIFKTLLKTLIGAAVASSICFGLNKVLNIILPAGFIGTFINLLVCGIISVIIYIVLMIVLKSSEITELFSIIKNKTKAE
ncbi:MAG: murein biosynthesis integral membrane protein MurJ [Clostridia bacterium]|nr:murein biosynthesis integral membrane protein MurJ [Clostridia bacterium]